MIHVKGYTFNDVESAKYIWFISTITSIDNKKKKIPFISTYNEPEKLPTIGSLLIYSSNPLQPHGHVSVVSDIKDDKIYISEQNKDNKTRWSGNYARIIHIINQSITHEHYLIGWKTIN